jgi:hypothetical protein
MGPPFLLAPEGVLNATPLFSAIWRLDVLSANLVSVIFIINIVASRRPFSRAGLRPAPGSEGQETSLSGPSRRGAGCGSPRTGASSPRHRFLPQKAEHVGDHIGYWVGERRLRLRQALTQSLCPPVGGCIVPETCLSPDVAWPSWPYSGGARQPPDSPGAGGTPVPRYRRSFWSA